jgi:hypothetical protein
MRADECLSVNCGVSHSVPGCKTVRGVSGAWLPTQETQRASPCRNEVLIAGARERRTEAVVRRRPRAPGRPMPCAGGAAEIELECWERRSQLEWWGYRSVRAPAERQALERRMPANRAEAGVQDAECRCSVGAECYSAEVLEQE